MHKNLSNFIKLAVILIALFSAVHVFAESQGANYRIQNLTQERDAKQTQMDNWNRSGRSTDSPEYTTLFNDLVNLNAEIGQAQAEQTQFPGDPGTVRATPVDTVRATAVGQNTDVIVDENIIGYAPNGSTLYQAPGSTTVYNSDGNPVNLNGIPTAGGAAGTTNSGDALGKAVGNLSCGVFSVADFEGCLVKFFYWVFFFIPSKILVLTAKLFDAMLALALSTELYKSSFISVGWTVVRDLSNIFFILVLLYVAIQTILGIGHETKKVIVQVVIMALLINFSMFFTKVVIDSSNILALVFYNKIAISTPQTNTTFNPSKTGVPEKNLSGDIASAFNPNRFLTDELFKAARTETIPNPEYGWKNRAFDVARDSTKVLGGAGIAAYGALTAEYFRENGKLPPEATIVTKKEGTGTGEYLGIIIVACAVFLFASYAFFIAGISFLGRLLELWILIIFSPFAFVSSTLPVFKQVKYINWEEWLTRLIKVSFMAPIFMFFMFLIVKLIQIPFWKDMENNNLSQTEKLLTIIIPAAIVLTLLLKATKYAREGSGAVGDAVFSAAKMAGGLALGAATGGAAVLGRATIGRAGAAIAESDWAKKRESEGKFGSTLIRSGAKAVGTGSFDVRGTKFGGKALSAAGINAGEAQKGGFTERREAQVKKRQERAKELQVGEDEPLKQALNKTEMDLQSLLGENAQAIEGIDKLIEKKRQEAADAKRQADTRGAATINAATGLSYGQESIAAEDKLQEAKDNKTKLRTGLAYTDHNGTVQPAAIGAGGSIDVLEKQQKIDAQAIKSENVKRNKQYADTSRTGWERAKGYVFSGGTYTESASEEAAHKIIMETKLDSGTKPH